MAETKKEGESEAKIEETSKVENADDNIEAGSALLKEAELDKDADNLDDDNEVEYHRKSFRAREYKSETVEQTQKEVEELIVKRSR